MKKMCEEAEKIMTERFGKDMVIALATAEKGVPYVRYVNAYYENGAFYVITYALSNKIKHLENNPVIAIAGEWFTAHGKGINLGYFMCGIDRWAFAFTWDKVRVLGFQFPEGFYYKISKNRWQK